MKFKKVMPAVFILLAILTIGAVSAHDDIAQDGLTVQTEEIQEASVLPDLSYDDNGSDVLSQAVVSEDNPDDSAQSTDAVLAAGVAQEDIKIVANTKTINVTNGNAVIAYIKTPKGANAYVDLSPEGTYGLDTKLSNLPVKSTKNGITTYTIRVKDLVDYKQVGDEIKNGGYMFISVKYYDKNEKGYDVKGNSYLIKFNKNTKALKLKQRIQTDVWASNYDRQSGKNKKLTIHLETWKNKKPLAGKKVKITIYGVVYYKKTDSKGVIKMYPPKYLPPRQAHKVRMEFAGDDTYTNCITINDIQIYKNSNLAKSEVKASKKTFTSNATKKYTVKLLSNGKAVKKAKLTLTIKGKKYTANTDSKGKATFNLSKFVKKGTFSTTIVYMGDKHHYMSYKKVKLTVK